MNRLVRGVERSGCLLRSRRLGLSTSKSSSVVCAQNLIVPVSSNNYDRRCLSSIASTPINALENIDRFALGRNLSMSAAVATDTSSGDNFEQDESSSTTIVERKPSALEQANLEEITPGHAMYVLQRYASTVNGNKLIRQSDFVALCESSRPGKMKDAKVIAKALRDFKRCNRFVLQIVGSRAAIDGMMRSMTPTWKIQDGKPKVKAALFVLEQILDGLNTGLYYTVSAEDVNEIFEVLHEGLLEMEKNGMKLRIDNIKEEKEAEEGEEPEGKEETRTTGRKFDLQQHLKCGDDSLLEVEGASDVEQLARNTLRLTEGVMKVLINRRMRPEWEMKKRAKRQYLQRLQIGGGPHQTTLQLATKISLLVAGSEATEERIVAPFGEAKKTAKVDEITRKLVEDAKALEASAAEDDVADDNTEEAQAEDGVDVEADEAEFGDEEKSTTVDIDYDKEEEPETDAESVEKKD